MKPCIECGLTKPLDDFYRHAGMKDGHFNKCKPCFRACVRLNRKKNQSHYRDYSKPLDVEWLCPRCHAVADNRAGCQI